MLPLLDRLRAGDVVVADGAWGTMLMARGLQPGEPPETFNLTNTGDIEDIARLYLEAGAEIVTTNTFGASPLRLRDYQLDGEVERINREAVLAARRIVGGRAYLSASIGPSGKLLAPVGDVDPLEVSRSFLAQAAVLAEVGVDLFCVETMTDLVEARLAVTAVRQAAPGVPVMATMTFDPTPRGFRTVMGVSVAQAARGLVDAGADILGSNCGNGIAIMTAVARDLRAQTTHPLAIRANAGLPELRQGVLVYPEGPQAFGGQVAALVAAGVQIIGGCCGTTPAHVRAIRAAVDAVGGQAGARR